MGATEKEVWYKQNRKRFNNSIHMIVKDASIVCS